MLDSIFVQLGLVYGGLIVAFVAVKCVSLLRQRRTNTELWATFFEGLTHKTHNLDSLKVPEVYEERQIKKDGEDKDSKKARRTDI